MADPVKRGSTLNLWLDLSGIGRTPGMFILYEGETICYDTKRYLSQLRQGPSYLALED